MAQGHEIGNHQSKRSQPGSDFNPNQAADKALQLWQLAFRRNLNNPGSMGGEPPFFDMPNQSRGCRHGIAAWDSADFSRRNDGPLLRARAGGTGLEQDEGSQNSGQWWLFLPFASAPWKNGVPLKPTNEKQEDS